MANKNALEYEQNLFSVDFSLLTNQGLSEDAVEIFEDEFEDYYWVLTQNGIFVREERHDLKKIKLVVDTTDEWTRDSVERLILTSDFSKLSTKRHWCLNIFDADDPDFTDVMICLEGTFYCRDIFCAWKQAKTEIGSFLRNGIK